MSDNVNHPEHYPEGSIEIIEQVIDGLDAKSAYFLGNVLKYVIRAGKKNDDDLEKANNYAHRLCTGRWRWEEGVETYPYVFPDATNMADDWLSQVYKIKEECDEVIEIVDHMKNSGVAFVGPLHEMLVEVLDVIHACETLLRLMDWNESSTYYYDMAQLRDEVIEKNRKRGYYEQDAEG